VKHFSVILLAILLGACNKTIVRYAGSSDVLFEEVAPHEPMCKKSFSYIPDPMHMNATPVRYVRVNFHIMQAADGSGSFSEAQGRDFIRELVKQSNIRWANNQQMNLPEGNTTPLIPIPIRIVLQKDAVTGEDAIYFHKDDTLAFWNRSAKKGVNSLSDRTVIEKYKVGSDSIINIFLIEHHPDSINSPTYGGATLSGISFISALKLFSMYNQFTTVKYRDDGSPFTHDVFFLSKLLNHELGHSFGLNHTWNWDDGCEDTPKNPGCWSQTGKAPCDGIISNNMMDYNWNQQAVTPCQLGRMEYSFYKEKDGVRNYVIPLWCEYHPFERVVIYKYEQVVWDGGKDLWGDIEIREGAILTIRCDVSLPAKAKVIIKPGGKLIIDGGNLTNRCGDQFEGIEIWENKKSGEIGKVVLTNNGQINNIVHFSTVQETPVENPDSGN
jgi:hypothetical protein